MEFLPILLPFLEAVTGKRINPGGPKRPLQKTDEFGGRRPKKKRINVRQSRIFQDGLHVYIPGSCRGAARFRAHDCLRNVFCVRRKCTTVVYKSSLIVQRMNCVYDIRLLQFVPLIFL